MQTLITLLVTAGLALCCPALAQAEIIANPAAACSYLARYAAPEYQASRAEAMSISGFHGRLFVDSPEVIAKVGHIPGVPYLSSIPAPGDCVAVAPVLLGTSTHRGGRSWLWLLGIAGTEHRAAYTQAVEAANHPFLRHVASWMGFDDGIAKKAVLASECQASRWLHSPDAPQEFALIEGDFAGDKYLPTVPQMMQKIRACSR